MSKEGIGKKLKVVELFAGIGAQAQALEDLGIEFESTVCEIDKHAYESYCAIHGDTPNLGDITKVQRLPECDLMTWSFPCQSLSIAGSQTGMVEGSGTTSSLAWEVIRLLRTAKEEDTLPKYLVMENVYALLNKRNRESFAKLREALEELGYANSYAVLNAKDYGVPQNRKRVFMVSSLDGREFVFPETCPDGRILKDVLEENVAEEFFLTDERIAKYEEHRQRHQAQGHGLGWKPSTTEAETSPAILTNPQKGDTMSIIVEGMLNVPGFESANRVYGTEGIAPTIPTGAGGGHMPKIKDTLAYPAGTKKGYMEAHEGDGLVMMRPTLARGTVQSQSTPTLTTGNGCGTGVVVRDNDYVPELQEGEAVAMLTPGREKRQQGPRCKADGNSFTVTCQDRHGVAMNDGGKLRIRYLTPRECWRLMGFSDEAFDKAESVTSRTQLYKQAGNSIAVPCLKAIFKGMFFDDRWSEGDTLERWCD